MRSFRNFLENKNIIPPILIPVDPNHGSHSFDEGFIPPILIPVDPNHGSHSRKRTRLKEEHTHSQTWLDQNDNDHLGHDHEEVTNKIDIPEKKFKAMPEHDHVFGYTSSSSRLNRYHLNKAKGQLPEHENEFCSKEKTQKNYEKYEEQSKHLDSAVKSHKLDHDLHVYHGTHSFNPGELASQHPDRLIKSAAYMSTSVHKATAHDFALGREHIIHIHLKKGEHALPIGRNSVLPEEHETLLPRGTTLKIHHEPTHLSSGATVWHAHIHHGED